MDFVKILLNTGITLHKTGKDKMRSFLNKYTESCLKSTTHYQTSVVDKLYAEKYSELSSKFISKEYYLMFDETTDIKGHNLSNILVGLWSNSKENNPMLIKMVELRKSNADNVLKKVLNIVSSFPDGNISKTKIKLVLSDMAPYALKELRLLKDVLPSLKHITCIAHMLHLVCETLRKESAISDRLFADINHKLKNKKKTWGLFTYQLDLNYLIF
ncbi:hypothetical protein DMUE_4420 [Dictyocoela muelleri]|nr:hypothetical protein DMUE_4420 [Dictyocoela muelleri]